MPRGRGSKRGTTRAVAIAAMPSPRPVRPRPSVVVADRDTGAPASARLSTATASARRGPILGLLPMTQMATSRWRTRHCPPGARSPRAGLRPARPPTRDVTCRNARQGRPGPRRKAGRHRPRGPRHHRRNARQAPSPPAIRAQPGIAPVQPRTDAHPPRDPPAATSPPQHPTGALPGCSAAGKTNGTRPHPAGPGATSLT